MGVPIFGILAKKIFGTRNQRMVRRYLRIVDQVNAREDDVRALTDAEIMERTKAFRSQVQAGANAYDLIPDVFAVAREVMDRAVGIRATLNPAGEFDPTILSERGRALYGELTAASAALPPSEPVEALKGCAEPVEGWQMVEIPLEYYAEVRKALPYPDPNDPNHGRVPPFRARPFDVQIIGGIVLAEGQIAEMKTGEGKTIVGPLACYLAACEAKQVHVVTVNDYLVQRDRDWTFPFFRALGLTVGAIHPLHMQSQQGKATAYSCDVVYGTTSEFGFDYLRDNMKTRRQDQVQKSRDFAIVDEVDSTLIDEARTPLIISGPAYQQRPRYAEADSIAKHLVSKQKPWQEADDAVSAQRSKVASIEGKIRNTRDKGTIPQLQKDMSVARKAIPALEAAREEVTQFYEVELDRNQVTITHQGIEEAQRAGGMGSFYVGENMDMPHLLEQALRAHTCYQRDKDYVVAADEDGQEGIIIVDQNTGRKMIGRQWSNGLHQAMEAKEGVRIRDETQTVATVTVQNFFKLYKRLAGMTGTADTEATEFHEIYRLDVVSIPTNLPIQRSDRADIVFLTGKDKWKEVVEEIRRCHDVGRPVLVGTTSVEKSERLAEMLRKAHNIPHEVLNAKQHEREADIVAGAGSLGAVMIATNMAGRGTDIKLRTFSREELLTYWQRRNLAPREVEAVMGDEEILARCYRHQLTQVLRLPKKDAEALTGDEARLRMMRHWVEHERGVETEKASRMSAEQCERELDSQGAFLSHRLAMWTDAEEIGGLHIVGTERHESRRIDNQLRGRSGRQGDQGSSRFFLGLDDDLMKMFAGKATLNMLSRLGMKEGDAIESPMLSRQIQKAQRKVEERNFQIRKSILDYDEPMEHQRQSFYGMRQPVVEGKNVRAIVLRFVDEELADASRRFLDKHFVPKVVSEWVWEHFGVMVEPGRFVGKDREQTLEVIRVDTVGEKWAQVEVGLGELLHEEADPSEWDRDGIKSWARTHFGFEVPDELLTGSDRHAIRRAVEGAAKVQCAAVDLTPIEAFLAPDYGTNELANWATNKLGVTIPHEDLRGVKDPAEAEGRLKTKVRELYARREVTYPISFALEQTMAQMAGNPALALGFLCRWANTRYGLDWAPDRLPGQGPEDLRQILLHEAESWNDERFDRRAKDAIAAGARGEQVAEWFRETYGVLLSDEEVAAIEKHGREVVARRIREVHRGELTMFEQWILLQIMDTTWKEHLHAMDQLRDAIGLRYFSQKDPRIEFKRESARYFNEMHSNIRDRLTDIVLKGRLAPQPAQPAAAPKGEPTPRPAGDAASAPPQPTAPPPPEIPAPKRAGAVGRNEPCPCGSGKKYKNCCGK